MSTHEGPPPRLTGGGGLPAPWPVTLECGHSGRAWGTPRVGQWVSCWAIVHSGDKLGGPHCQTQRRVTSVGVQSAWRPDGGQVEP